MEQRLLRNRPLAATCAVVVTAGDGLTNTTPLPGQMFKKQAPFLAMQAIPVRHSAQLIGYMADLAGRLGMISPGRQLIDSGGV
jgi:hypothetical protein